MRIFTYAICTLLIAGLLGSTAGATQIAASEEEVFFRNGETRLAGIFFLPQGSGPFPAAVFIRGSGPSSRQSHWARSLANVFLDAGVAVLLPDKRGSGQSEGDWRTADFETLAADSLAAADYLRQRPEIDAGSVGIAGLSQGGKIAPVAATEAEPGRVAFLVNFVGSSTPVMEQISWEMYHTFREAGLQGQALSQALELQVLAEQYVQGGVAWQIYRDALDRALQGPWAEVAEGFPSAPDSWRWDFFRRIGNFDPLPYWRRVKQPILVFYGEEDRNAPTVRSAYRLLRAFVQQDHPDATIHILTDAGHGLWSPGSAGSPKPELHPELVHLLQEWLRGR